MFDVAIGAFDRTEVCKLVGKFLLHKLSEYKKERLSLQYRDDGLRIFKNVSGPVDQLQKKLKKYFWKLF